jgi:hypothetical protein
MAEQEGGEQYEEVGAAISVHAYGSCGKSAKPDMVVCGSQMLDYTENEQATDQVDAGAGEAAANDAAAGGEDATVSRP